MTPPPWEDGGGARPVDNPHQLINKDKSIHDRSTSYKFLVFIHRSQQHASDNSTNIAQGQRTSFYGNYTDYSRETE